MSEAPEVFHELIVASGTQKSFKNLSQHQFSSAEIAWACTQLSSPLDLVLFCERYCVDTGIVRRWFFQPRVEQEALDEISLEVVLASYSDRSDTYSSVEEDTSFFKQLLEKELMATQIRKTGKGDKKA